MTKIKALHYTAPGKMNFIEIDYISPKDNEVGIRNLGTSLCNFCELHSFRGNPKAKTGYGSKYPMEIGEPGHEGVGKIISVGKNVKDFKKDDIVVMTGHGGLPVFRSHVNRNTEDIAKIIPGKRNLKSAAILEMFGCAYHCLKAGWREPNGFDNARIAIIGLGAIGLCTLQIAKLLPLSNITVYDINQEKLSIAEKMGADNAFIPSSDFNNISLEKPYDFVIECSGHPNGGILATALKPKCIINTSCCFSPIKIEPTLWFESNTTIYNPGILTSVDLKSVANLYNRNLIDPEPLISLRLPPTVNAYHDALKSIQENKIIKAVIDWEM